MRTGRKIESVVEERGRRGEGNILDETSERRHKQVTISHVAMKDYGSRVVVEVKLAHDIEDKVDLVSYIAQVVAVSQEKFATTSCYNRQIGFGDTDAKDTVNLVSDSFA